MKRLQKLITIALLTLTAGHALAAEDMISKLSSETPTQRDARMKWWREARFGMFVHWGLFSAAGGTWEGKPSPSLGCWMQYLFQIPTAEYSKVLMPKFTGERFDPQFIAQLAKDAGMKYIVPITKHHEGFCLFDSKYTDFKITNTPAKRDWIKELSNASRQRGLKVGYYYSQNLDWHHKGGGGCEWDPTVQGDPDKYVNELVIPQLRELLTNYGDISVMWFDIPGGVIDEARANRILKVVHELRPNILYNDRLGGGFAGDFVTPEQYIPPTGVTNRDWETCQTINGTWEYTHYDRNWKSPTTLIRQLIDTSSKGANLLLNIGPKPDGTVPQTTIDTLHAIGKWMKVHGESIYGTSASPFKRPPTWGRCTQKPLANGVTRLYLHIFNWPFDSVLQVPPLENEVVSASLLTKPGSGPLKFSKGADGSIAISLPIAEPNDHATVVMLDVKGTPKVIPTYYSIVADAKGAFSLGAGLADIHGQTMQYQSDHDSLGYWTDANDYASWLVKFAKPGCYQVEVTYGCAPNGGGEYVVELLGKQLVASSQKTAGWFDLRTDSIGVLEVDKAGAYPVALRVKRLAGLAVFDVRSVVLRPVD